MSSIWGWALHYTTLIQTLHTKREEEGMTDVSLVQPQSTSLRQTIHFLAFRWRSCSSLCSIALYYISLLIGFGKYSIEWRPPICVCRLEMELLRPQYTKFDLFFFCKMLNVHMWRPPKKNLGDFYSLLGGSGKLFAEARSFRGICGSPRKMWF